MNGPNVRAFTIPNVSSVPAPLSATGVTTLSPSKP